FNADATENSTLNSSESHRSCDALLPVRTLPCCTRPVLRQRKVSPIHGFPDYPRRFSDRRFPRLLLRCTSGHCGQPVQPDDLPGPNITVPLQYTDMYPFIQNILGNWICSCFLDQLGGWWSRIPIFKGVRDDMKMPPVPSDIQV